jgi:hypothetical protein
MRAPARRARCYRPRPRPAARRLGRAAAGPMEVAPAAVTACAAPGWVTTGTVHRPRPRGPKRGAHDVGSGVEGWTYCRLHSGSPHQPGGPPPPGAAAAAAAATQGNAAAAGAERGGTGQYRRCGRPYWRPGRARARRAPSSPAGAPRGAQVAALARRRRRRGRGSAAERARGRFNAWDAAARIGTGQGVRRSVAPRRPGAAVTRVCPGRGAPGWVKQGH